MSLRIPGKEPQASFEGKSRGKGLVRSRFEVHRQSTNYQSPITATAVTLMGFAALHRILQGHVAELTA